MNPDWLEAAHHFDITAEPPNILTVCRCIHLYYLLLLVSGPLVHSVNGLNPVPHS